MSTAPPPEPPAGTDAHAAWEAEQRLGEFNLREQAMRTRAILAARGELPAPAHAAGRKWVGLNEVAGRPLDIANAYGALIGVTLERAESYAMEIDRQLTAAGDDEKARKAVLVVTSRVYDDESKALIDNGEQDSALVRAERAERALAAKLITEGARMQLDATAARSLRQQQRVFAAAARRVAEAAGLVWSDEESRRIAQAALLAARDEVERADGAA